VLSAIIQYAIAFPHTVTRNTTPKLLNHCDVVTAGEQIVSIFLSLFNASRHAPEACVVEIPSGRASPNRHSTITECRLFVQVASSISWLYTLKHRTQQIEVQQISLFQSQDFVHHSTRNSAKLVTSGGPTSRADSTLTARCNELNPNRNLSTMYLLDLREPLHNWLT